MKIQNKSIRKLLMACPGDEAVFLGPSCEFKFRNSGTSISKQELYDAHFNNPNIIAINNREELFALCSKYPNVHTMFTYKARIWHIDSIFTECFVDEARSNHTVEVVADVNGLKTYKIADNGIDVEESDDPETMLRMRDYFKHMRLHKESQYRDMVRNTFEKTVKGSLKKAYHPIDISISDYDYYIISKNNELSNKDFLQKLIQDTNCFLDKYSNHFKVFNSYLFKHRKGAGINSKNLTNDESVIQSLMYDYFTSMTATVYGNFSQGDQDKMNPRASDIKDIVFKLDANDLSLDKYKKIVVTEE